MRDTNASWRRSNGSSRPIEGWWTHRGASRPIPADAVPMLELFLVAFVAQDTTPPEKFLRRREAVVGVATLAATAALSAYDERIAAWTRQPNVQGDSVRHDRVSLVTKVNEMPLTAAAIATYGIGRLTRSRTI